MTVWGTPLGPTGARQDDAHARSGRPGRIVSQRRVGEDSWNFPVRTLCGEEHDDWKDFSVGTRPGVGALAGVPKVCSTCRVAARLLDEGEPEEVVLGVSAREAARALARTIGALGVKASDAAGAFEGCGRAMREAFPSGAKEEA